MSAVSPPYLFYSPRFRPLSATGAIMPLCYIQFYKTGTTTPTNVYADAALATPLSNPVVADLAGQFPKIYLDPAVTYRAQLYDASNVLQWDDDPLAPPRDYPSGTIVLFFGTATQRNAAYPTTLWQVCDGTNGTPDCRDRLLMFAGGTYQAGDTGGSTGSATTSAAGGHDHGGTDSAVALTEAQMPTHHHSVRDRGGGSGIADGSTLTSTQSLAGIRNVGEGGFTENNSLGHQFISDTGDGDAHQHDISAEPDHTHTVSVEPPFIALWAVMRK
jgi:hypothetical protein